MSEHLILLAPQEQGDLLKGVMIAEAAASGKQVAGTWEGQRLLVSVPTFDGFVVAQPVELKVLRQLGAGAAP